MPTRVDKTPKTKNQSVPINTPQKQGGSESAFQFLDNRIKSTTEGSLQNIAANGPMVRRLRVLQAMAQSSPQAYQAAQSQAMADQRSTQQTLINTKNINAESSTAIQTAIPFQLVKFSSPIEGEKAKFSGENGHIDCYNGVIRPWLVNVKSDHPEARAAAEQAILFLDSKKSKKSKKSKLNPWDRLYEVIEAVNAKIGTEGAERAIDPENELKPAQPEDVKIGLELEFYNKNKTQGIRVKDSEDVQDMKDQGKTVSKGYLEKQNKKARKLYGWIEREWLQELSKKRIDGFSYVIDHEDHKGHGIQYMKIAVKKDNLEWWYKPTIDDDVLEIVAKPFSLRELDEGLAEVIQHCVFDIAKKIGFSTFKGDEKFKKPLGNHLNVDMTTAFANLGNVTRFMIESYSAKSDIEKTLASSGELFYEDKRNASFVDDDLLPEFKREMEAIALKCDNSNEGYTISGPKSWAYDIDKLMVKMRDALEKRKGGGWGEKMNYQHYMAVNAEHVGKQPDQSAWRIEMRTSIMPKDVKELRQKIAFITELRDKSLQGY